MIETPKKRIVEVDVQPRAYLVFIGAGALAELGDHLREHVKSRRVVVLTDENVGPLYADQVMDTLGQADFKPSLVTVPAGEFSKSLAQVSKLYDAVADARLDRTSAIVALGGGMVGDLAGFVAATWMRGIHFVQCPTTILADVDASVGGKTGVNHSSGKNMVGAFYQPRFVLIDTSTLRTLSERDFRAGLAESIKHAIIRDADFFEWHEKNAETVLAYDADALGALVERNVRIKARIVAADEREISGERALLNFGHTVGHAIESAMSLRYEAWRHGECVAIGMIAATEIAVAAGKLDRASADRIAALLSRIGLPTHAPLDRWRWELEDRMRLDKKTSAGELRFVLPDRIGQATLYDNIKPEWISAGLDRVLTRD